MNIDSLREQAEKLQIPGFTKEDKNKRGIPSLGNKK
jgi:hypothetical protein